MGIVAAIGGIDSIVAAIGNIVAAMGGGGGGVGIVVAIGQNALSLNVPDSTVFLDPVCCNNW